MVQRSALLADPDIRLIVETQPVSVRTLYIRGHFAMYATALSLSYKLPQYLVTGPKATITSNLYLTCYNKYDMDKGCYVYDLTNFLPRHAWARTPPSEI